MTRATGRLVGVDNNTVTRYVALAGAHSESLPNELVALSPRTREVQVDGKWAFVGKKEAARNPLDPLDQLSGDDRDHTAVDPESWLLLALVPGKRDGDACKAHFELTNQGRARFSSPSSVADFSSASARSQGETHQYAEDEADTEGRGHRLGRVVSERALDPFVTVASMVGDALIHVSDLMTRPLRVLAGRLGCLGNS